MPEDFQPTDFVPDEQAQPASDFVPDEPAPTTTADVLRQKAKSLAGIGRQLSVVGTVTNPMGALNAVGQVIHYPFGVLSGVGQDVAENIGQMAGVSGTEDHLPWENLGAKLLNEESPLESKIKNVEGFTGGAARAVQDLPAIVSSMGVAGEAGNALKAATTLPNWVAQGTTAAAMFGSNREGFDPKNAAVTFFFPAIGELGGSVALKALAKFGIKPESAIAENAIKAAGSVAANQAYMDAVNSPEYLNPDLSADEKKSLFFNGLAQNIGFHLAGIPGLVAEGRQRDEIQKAVESAAKSYADDFWKGVEKSRQEKAAGTRSGAVPPAIAPHPLDDIFPTPNLKSLESVPIPKGVSDAETIRRNQEIVPAPGQVVKGSEATGGNDVEQPPSGTGKGAGAGPEEEKKPGEVLTPQQPAQARFQVKSGNGRVFIPNPDNPMMQMGNSMADTKANRTKLQKIADGLNTGTIKDPTEQFLKGHNVPPRPPITPSPQPANGIAPVKFIGVQPGFQDIPPMKLYNLTEDVPGLGVKDSTIAEASILRAGYTIPNETPTIPPSATSETTKARQPTAPTTVDTGAAQEGMQVGLPPVKPGFVRMYHGGSDPTGELNGDRSITPYFYYAKGYAAKTDSPVWYVDVPENAPYMKKAGEDILGGTQFPYINTTAPSEVMKGAKLASPKPVPKQEEVPVAEKPVTVPATSKYRIGASPQTYSLVETLPQSEVEKANGEQPVKVKNDKTGAVQTVMESDLTPVKESTTHKSPKRDLDAELRAEKLDPSVFPNAESKREAIKRSKALQGQRIETSEIGTEERRGQPRQEMVRSPIRWVGGKRQFMPLLQRLMGPLLREGKRLVEPFFGSGTVTLGLRPKEALANDANAVLANFHKRLADGLKYDLPYKANAEDFAKARSRYNELIRTRQATTEEAAKLFYYLNQTAHGGLYRVNSKGEFNVPFQGDKEGKPIKPLEDYQEAYKNVTVKNGNYDSLDIKPNDIIYSDPPYDSEFAGYQAGGFNWDEQVNHARWLSSQDVPVITQNEATPRILELYRGLGFDVHVLDARRSISRDATNRGLGSAKEMIAFKNVPKDLIDSALAAQGQTDTESEERPINEGSATGTKGIRELLSRSNYPQHQIGVALDLLGRLERSGLDLSELELNIKQHGDLSGSALGNLMEMTGKADATTFPHEVFHWLHELLPVKYKQALNELRLAELRKIYGEDIPPHLASGTMTTDEFIASDFPRDQYRLINTSEFLSDFAGRTFAEESFKNRNEPETFWRTMRNDIQRWVRLIVGTVKNWFRVRPDMREIYQSLLDGTWKTSPESGAKYEKRGSLAVSPQEYHKQEAFGERALPERTLAAYGDLTQIKTREADAINASEQARKMVAIPNQDLLASMASTDLAVNRFVLDNYAQMKARVAGSDPGLKWSVTQDALHAVENEKVRAARTRKQFDEQASKLKKPGFLKTVQRMFDREEQAKTAEEIASTYKAQIGQAAGDVIRELNAKGKTEAQLDQLRSDYNRLQQMQQFSTAVEQKVNDIINTVAAGEDGLQLLYGIPDKSGQKIYDAYLDMAQQNANPKGPGGMIGLVDESMLSASDRARLQETRRLAESTLLTGDQKIFARLAAQVISANTALRWEMASKAHMLANPDFKAKVTAVGEKFRKAYEKDPGKAIGQIVKTASSLTSKAVTAEGAWLRLQREVMPEMRRYETLRQAAEIDERTANSAEYKALVNQIHKDAGAISIPTSERAAGVTALTAFPEYSGRQVVRSPNGGEYEINLGYTKKSVEAAQGQMQLYLGDLASWLTAPKNADSPDRAYWQQRYDFIQNAVNVSDVLAPSSIRSFVIQHGGTMMDFFFKETSIPAAKLAWTAGGNWFRSFNIQDQWYNGVVEEWMTRNINAMRSHGMNQNTDSSLYQQQVMSRLAGEYRRGNALKAGDRLNNGMVITAQDLAFLEYQGRAITDLFTRSKNLGRTGVMGKDLVVDQWNKSVFVLRTPQEIGARVGTTLPHEFNHQAIALARRVGQLQEGDLNGLQRLIDTPEIFEEFAQRFFAERGADYSVVTPFEDIYKELASKWMYKSPDAPHDMAGVFDFINSRTTDDYNLATIRQAILGEMETQLRNFNKLNVDMEAASSDVRAQRATKDSAFTKGFQRDIGSSFFYDYGAKSAPEVRALGIDSTNFHLVRFVKALDASLKAYDDAIAELTTARDPKKMTLEQMRKLRSGEDFRDFERIQSERRQLKYYRDQIAQAYGSSAQNILDLFSPAGGALRFMTGAALTGIPTLGKVVVGSTVKAGLVLSAMEKFALKSYWNAGASTVMSTGAILAKGAVKVPIEVAKSVRENWNQGVGFSVAKGLETAFDSLFRQGKYFNQQYDYGLGFKNPVGMRVYNQIRMPYTEGMGYDFKLSDNLLRRWSQIAFYRAWSTALRPPLEVVKAMFPQLGYAISYDAVARAGSWTIDGMAAQARRAFEYLEKTGGIRAFDLNRPNSLQNLISAEHIIPRGIIAPDQTNLNFARQWFSRAVDVPLNETVINYWKKLSETPKERRGDVSFLAPEKSGEDVQKFEDGRMGALLSVLLKDVHHASPENRPLLLRTNRTLRFLYPMMGWTSDTIRDTAYRLGVAPTGNQFKMRMVAAAGALAFLVGATAFGEAEKEVKKLLAGAVGDEYPEKFVTEARSGKEAAQLLALDAVSFIPFAHEMLAGLMTESAAMGGNAMTVFSADRFNALLRYFNGVVKTGDASFGLARLVNQIAPFGKQITSHLESQKGILTRRAVQTMLSKYGPAELSKGFTGGYAIPTELSPFKDRLSNAIFSGDAAAAQKAMDEFVTQVERMGRSPEEARKVLAQAVVSLNPIQMGSTKLTEAQRQEFLSRLNPDQLQIEQAAEQNYENALGMVGRATSITKQQPGGGGYSGSPTGITGQIGTRSHRAAGDSGLPSLSTGLPTGIAAPSTVTGGRVRGATNRGRIRSRGSVRNVGRVRGMRTPRLRRSTSHYRSGGRIRRSHNKQSYA